MASGGESPHETSDTFQPKIKRYYVLNSQVPFEEDSTHEFKGHRNLAVEEIPPWCHENDREKRSRAPVSKALNGFLNTGRGGTAYLGIVDCGDVKGINLTQYQKDHMMVSLDDVMSRYKPPVEQHRYSVKFIPVVSKDEPNIEDIVKYDSRSGVDRVSRQRPHVFRTNSYCWCDKDASAQINVGIMPPKYVVEINIKPWNPEDDRNQTSVGKMKTHPMHEDESGNLYFRRQATVVPYTIQEMTDVSRQTVLEHYQPQIERLKKELYELRLQASTKASEEDSESSIQSDR